MQCRGHHSSATSGDIATLTLPLLCAGGRYDAMVLPSTVEQAVATVNSGGSNATKANATAAFFEGGHGFLGQDPAAWEEVSKFLLRAAVDVDVSSRPSTL